MLDEEYLEYRKNAFKKMENMPLDDQIIDAVKMASLFEIPGFTIMRGGRPIASCRHIDTPGGLTTTIAVYDFMGRECSRMYLDTFNSLDDITLYALEIVSKQNKFKLKGKESEEIFLSYKIDCELREEYGKNTKIILAK